MATKVRVSKQFTINWSDVLRGGIVAALGSVGTVVYEAFNDAILKDQPVTINWSTVLNVAIFAFVGYLIKNFGIEPAKTIVITDTNTKAVNVADRIKKDVV